MATITYAEFKKNDQKSANDLPWFFAFSKDQLNDALAEKGLSLTDMKGNKILSLGAGCYCLKKDWPEIEAWDKAQGKSLKQLMKNEAFAKDAFKYEMNNHEYFINWTADWDTCSAFGNCEYGSDKDYSDYLNELGYSEKQIRWYKEARTELYKEWEEKNWF